MVFVPLLVITKLLDTGKSKARTIHIAICLLYGARRKNPPSWRRVKLLVRSSWMLGMVFDRESWARFGRLKGSQNRSTRGTKEQLVDHPSALPQ